MTPRSRAVPVTILLATAVLLCSASVLLGSTAAQAQIVRAPYATSTAFTELRPGDAAQTSLPVDLPVRATVTSATLQPSGRAGAFRWSAQLCDLTDRCVPVSDTVGRTYDAGTYRIELSVTAADDLQNGEQGSVAGRLVLVGEDDDLAVTGAAPWTLAALAAGCAVVGLGLLAVARRRAGLGGVR